jgi:hypothetical protein
LESNLKGGSTAPKFKPKSINPSFVISLTETKRNMMHKIWCNKDKKVTKIDIVNEIVNAQK